ncbi:MAG: HepT-like ribonuclease domain-containing protein [Bacteroidota bacterium]
MRRSDSDFLLDIKAECEIIIKHTENKNFQDLLDDDLLSRAIERSLEIIGEASKHISELTKQKSSIIEWKKIAGLRDIIIHQYFGVDYDLIWDVVTQKIPDLYHEIIRLLND